MGTAVDLVERVLWEPRLLGQPVVVLLEPPVEQPPVVAGGEHAVAQRGLGEVRGSGGRFF